MLNHAINQMLKYALDHQFLEPDDSDYAVNRVLYLFGLDTFVKEGIDEPVDFFIVMDVLLSEAKKRELIDDDITAKDNFEAKIIDCFLPRPSEINRKFSELKQIDSKKATDYFYQFSKDTNYIKTERIKKNISFIYEGKYAPLEITINLSKPEKDPKLIEQMRFQPESDYPKCALCMENVGYYGTDSKAPRSNHRVVSMTLDHETDQWGFQYSPYSYFNEHTIVLRKDHFPMKVDPKTFRELADFVDQFPHYLMGSNAGLPIVGGSILSHYHFQGGRYDFPIEKAQVIQTFHKGKVFVEALDWPMSSIRLVSRDRQKLLAMADRILAFWQGFSFPDLEILANTTEPHNTVTPIMRKIQGLYHFYLVLRNNRATEDRPYGLFHPREDLFHIKKENIGLIEVMGLAILPGRLKHELDQIRFVLENNLAIAEYPELEKHRPWVEKIREKALKSFKLEYFLRFEVGRVFEEVIEDCGVFKRKDRQAFLDFVETACQ
jgi:UDPglucose--hexose-1-phosphate uridylyltransferase